MQNNNHNTKTWHERHVDDRTIGQKIADSVANGMGSWGFILLQTLFVIVWMAFNVIGLIYHWDPYPFILLNLLFSTQAAYAAPIIMMAQNRQNERDRYHAAEDFKTNLAAKKEIEELQAAIARIENEKLNEVLNLLKNNKK